MIEWVGVFLVPILLGIGWVSLFFPKKPRSSASVFLLVFSGLGAGFAFVAVIYFLAILLGFPMGRLGLLEVGVTGLLFIVLLGRGSRGEGLELESARAQTQTEPRRVCVVLAFIGIAGLAALRCYSVILRDPQGGWDAFAMWNLKARFFFLDAANWREMLDLEGFHAPAHPLLLPTCVARGWTLLGSENPLVPQTLGLLFGLGAVGVLMSVLALFRSGREACLGGLVLLGVSDYPKLAASQMADTPAGYFLLCALVFYVLALQAPRNRRAFLFLSGVFISFAVWLKNEGLVYLLSIALARFLLTGVRRYESSFLKEMGPFLGGAFPLVLMTLLYRSYAFAHIEYDYPVDLKPQLDLLLDYRRWLEVIWICLTSDSSLTRLALPAFLVYVILSRPRIPKEEEGSLYTLILTLVFCVWGYLYIFINTNHSLAFYIPGTWPRLQMHLLPAFILAAVLATSSERKANPVSATEPSPLEPLPLH